MTTTIDSKVFARTATAVETGPSSDSASLSRAFRKAMERLLHHESVRSYPLSERRAVLCHYLYLRYQIGPEVTLREGIDSWEGGACKSWRQEKMRIDGRQQLQQIKRHRERLIRERGTEVRPDDAAEDWCTWHAAAWRRQWEEQLDSTPMVFPYFFFNFLHEEGG